MMPERVQRRFLKGNSLTGSNELRFIPIREAPAFEAGELHSRSARRTVAESLFVPYPKLPVIYSSVFSCVGEVKTSSVVPNSNSSPRSMNPV